MSALPPATDRAAFVEALRIRWPTLWRKLHAEVWRASPPPNLREWAARQGLGIVDDWLLDALSQTLSYWTVAPDTPDARLADGHRWIFYFPSGIDVSDFEPKLDKPYPTYTAPDDLLARLLADTTARGTMAVFEECKIEPLDEFQERIMRQVREQLVEYTKRVRESFVYDSRPQMTRHAAWTALVLAGATIADITRAPEWLRFFKRGDPESTVGKAVHRFARRIGLTLPTGATKELTVTCRDSCRGRDKKPAKNRENQRNSP